MCDGTEQQRLNSLDGEEEDFQLFMALLDRDRFEGRFRDGVHTADVSDLMRRMVKENLLKFDGTPLFPERIAYAVPYKLSDAEAQLYAEVTKYVREEFNRADLRKRKARGYCRFCVNNLAAPPRFITRGYLLVSASSSRTARKPTARTGILHRGGEGASAVAPSMRSLDPDDVEDLEEAPDSEVEAVEEEILDRLVGSGDHDDPRLRGHRHHRPPSARASLSSPA
jgi:hypothetical protein